MDVESEESSRVGASRRGEPRPHVDLFLISFLILFAELACIRWFGSTVAFLTFFTNIVLLASFLGMSVGLMAASRRADLTRTWLPLLAAAVIVSILAAKAHDSWGQLAIEVGEQRKSPQQIFFGAENSGRNPAHFLVPIEVAAAFFFALIAASFLGLGQAMGRAFDAIPGRVAAYTTDVLGSLAGIAAFGLCSYHELPAYAWFAVIAVAGLALARHLTRAEFVAQWALLLAVAWLAYDEGRRAEVFWSPYYKVVYEPRLGLMTTNNIGHQQMVDVPRTGSAYVLPHLMARDAGAGDFADVAIVGAGSGNDVAAALAYGAKTVDAVEIEPVLNAIGRRDHPAHPYSDPRVTIHLDDGRSFLRRTSKSFDLIKYALVDSLVLHSGYTSLRLESFLFTEEAMRDVKARLKPGGVFLMCNYYRQGWVIGRLVQSAEKVFGTRPLVLSLPYQAKIDDKASGGFTLILVGASADSPVARIRERLEKDGAYWANGTPTRHDTVNAYGEKPPKAEGSAGDWQKIAESSVDAPDVGPLPTDDWPFLYLREARIPNLNLRGMAIVAVISAVLLLSFAPRGSLARFDGRMFFLGAGFMLLETKGVVHMALLFGATWVVNSLVFFSILVMILLSNLYVSTMRPARLWPHYGLLLVALGVNVLVPMHAFLDLPGAWKTAASCAVVFVPVFFAGVVFATTFRDRASPDVAFGWNVAGVVLGGLSENLSMVLGFDRLLLAAVAFYALSALLGPRRVPAVAAA
ncbi:Spermidine synthase [Aquisphaera giovannonii]|uniref:Spermidine synthase n=1 Tax=Aquisphaera giovannonii TaxID=406548 RepID=A0A5B9W5U3_9BACT|nr:hypothetical protein [Aquisphaera giovannonii]QEH35574.1 Spermidine synthase [Aquisphaera giovannonii]